MSKKYEVHNQLTGALEEAQIWGEAQQLRDRLRGEYIARMVDPLFQISVLVQNEDGSWTQSLADDSGEPTTPSVTHQAPPIPTTEL
jgi:hypothetical protein